MSVVAAAVIGAAVVGAGATYVSSKSAAKSSEQAAETQAGADVYAADLQRDMYNKQVELQDPFRQAGITAQDEMARNAYGEDYIRTQKQSAQTNIIEQERRYRELKAARLTAVADGATKADVDAMDTEMFDLTRSLGQARIDYDMLTQREKEGPRATTSTMGAEEQQTFNKLQEFTSGSMSDLANNPYYQFRQKEGQEQIEKNLAARGLQNSRAGLNMLADQEQSLTAEMVNDRYSKLGAEYDTLQQQSAVQENRLANLSNIGIGAAANQTAASGNYSALAGAAATQAGQNQANALREQGNIKANMINSIGSTTAGAIGTLGSIYSKG